MRACNAFLLLWLLSITCAAVLIALLLREGVKGGECAYIKL